MRSRQSRWPLTSCPACEHCLNHISSAASLPPAGSLKSQYSLRWRLTESRFPRCSEWCTGWGPRQSPLPVGSRWCSTRSESRGGRKCEENLLMLIHNRHLISPSFLQPSLSTWERWASSARFFGHILNEPEGWRRSQRCRPLAIRDANRVRMKRRWRLVSGSGMEGGRSLHLRQSCCVALSLATWHFLASLFSDLEDFLIKGRLQCERNNGNLEIRAAGGTKS